VEFAQGTPNAGEIDLVLENGDVTILIEVKTRLQVPRVRKHIEAMGKYRRCVDSKGRGDTMRFIGAVAGAVVENDAKDLAHENGMYVIVQSGKAVEILTPPEGFRAKEW
jgi:predicted AAA+ superfamily ATPase